MVFLNVSRCIFIKWSVFFSKQFKVVQSPCDQGHSYNEMNTAHIPSTCPCGLLPFTVEVTMNRFNSEPWNMPLTAQFDSLDYHTLSVYQERRPSEHVAFL